MENAKQNERGYTLGLTNEDVYKAFLANGCKVRKTARALGVHHKNVYNHLKRYMRIAGINEIHQQDSVEVPVVEIGEAPKPNEFSPGGARRFVITSATNDTVTNEKFKCSLMQYCSANRARLVVIPVRYKNPTSQLEDKQEISWDASLPIVDKSFQVAKTLWVMASIKVPATAENPLSGFDGMSKGNSLIIGHPQLSQINLPVLHGNNPAALWSTGSVSESVYSDTKTGVKAGFNHSLSALVVEVEDDDSYHIRDLNFDGTGFYDFNNYYHSEGVVRVKNPVDALIAGDTHVDFADPVAVAATYVGDDSICNVLRPAQVIQHDILDCYSVSHHHAKAFFTRFAKFMSGRDCIRTELENMFDFIVKYMPKFSKIVFVGSNHNNHFAQWLMSDEARKDMRNAEIYHHMMALVLKETRMTEGGASFPDPFRLWLEPRLTEAGIDCVFLSGDESYKVHDVELSMHGHLGVNGSRGNINQFSKLPTKNVSGHSHSSGINKGARKVGTTTRKRLEYNAGPSNWDHTHVVVYKNGCRQTISIINGRWRLDPSV